MQYSIFNANRTIEFFYAQQFVKPHEKYCCSIMQKILKKEPSVYLICKENKRSNIQNVVGVFCYTKGEVFLPCLPLKDKEVYFTIKKFCLEHNIFCVSGKSSFAEFVIDIINSCAEQRINELRTLHLMEYTKSKNDFSTFALDSFYNIFKCNKDDVNALMPLHLLYMQEEVLPQGSTLYPAYERLNVEEAVKNQIVIALQNTTNARKPLLAKAQTNAIGDSYMQIGGVFTLKTHRQKGFACHLVKYLAEYGLKQNKQSVLYVNEKNTHAIHSYQNAGFKIKDKYTIAYFDDKTE